MPQIQYYRNLLILLITLWVLTLGWFHFNLKMHFSHDSVLLWLGLMCLSLLIEKMPFFQQKHPSAKRQNAIWFGLLAWALILTTGLLYETGGTVNPLVHLLLLPLALGMLMLSSVFFIALALLSAGFYGFLNAFYVPIMSLKVNSLQAFFAWHLHGSMLVFILLVIFLAMFIFPLKKRLEKQRNAINQQRNQALQNEYLLSIASIASASAHQLSTPLNTLKLIEGLLAKEVHSDFGKELLKTYGEQVHICSQALQGLRKRAEFSQTQKMQAIPLNEFFNTLAQEFALLHPKSVLQTPNLQAEHNQLALKVDESFKLALMNLLDNAARYSPDSIVIAFQTTPSQFIFEIIDQGGGIKEAELAQLGLQPLDEYHGIGMGVFLSRMIIERFQGSLSFSHVNAPLKGLKASICLPSERLSTLENLNEFA